LVSAVHRYLTSSCGLRFHEYATHEHDATALLVEEFLERIEEASQRMSDLAEQLEREARTDPLTGLANRRYWSEWLTKEFERARRYGQPLGCSLVDLDNFKRVNDAYGHDVGDAVLIDLARVMRRNVRPSDLLCRYGGEEFTILLPQTDVGGAVEQAERLRRALEAACVKTHQQAVRVTASVGVATFPGPGVLTADDLVRAADQAMYRAKRSGRNTVATAAAGVAP
jgi:diguanylate cyclase (GGDEF)-like protein